MVIGFVSNVRENITDMQRTRSLTKKNTLTCVEVYKLNRKNLFHKYKNLKNLIKCFKVHEKSQMIKYQN